MEDQILSTAESLSSMTLEEKVAQMFMVRCPSPDAAAVQEKYQFGGYILFSADFRDNTPDQVREHIASYQDAAKIPMFIGSRRRGRHRKQDQSLSSVQSSAVPFSKGTV